MTGQCWVAHTAGWSVHLALNTRLTVAAGIPQFTVLAHRAVEYAEAHGRTVCVEGTPLDDLDLATLLPSLCETVGATA